MQRNRTRWTLLAAAVCVAWLGGANASAQDAAPKPVKSSGSADEHPSPVAMVRNEMRAMRNDKASAELLAAKVPGWLGTLFSAADAAKTPDERFDALALAIDVSLIARDDTSAAEKRKLAIERLLGEFVDDQAKMSSLLGTRAAVDGLRGKVLERTKSQGVKAVCVYGEAAELVMKARSGKLPEADETRMYALLERTAGEFGAEKDSKGRLFKDVATGAVRSLRDLLVGKVAPEIEGRDLDGAAFKLSDYRGKVVVLDFWGNW